MPVSFGGAGATAKDIWEYASRSLTDVSNVWSYSIRFLTPYSYKINDRASQSSEVSGDSYSDIDTVTLTKVKDLENIFKLNAIIKGRNRSVSSSERTAYFRLVIKDSADTPNTIATSSEKTITSPPNETTDAILYWDETLCPQVSLADIVYPLKVVIQAHTENDYNYASLLAFREVFRIG